MRFHVLAVPHAETNEKYISCAFTQKVLKWCEMMYKDHEIYHYGHELSEVKCTEHISVVSSDVLLQSVKWNIEKNNKPQNYNPLTHGFLFDRNDPANIEFRNNVPLEIKRRYKDDDFLLCFWGCGHIPVVEQLYDLENLHIVEPGIGYPYTFSEYRIFESEAKLHLVRGQQDVRYSMGEAGNMPYTTPSWFDDVIPNYWNHESFPTDVKKDDTLFFIGRLIRTKGLEIAVKIAEFTGRKLIIAGQGDIESGLGYTPNCDYEFIGIVNEQERNYYMSKAAVGITPSLYIEPFCGTHVEFWFNDTPIVATPWGVFSETIINGYNGYKCYSFDGGNEIRPSFLWALRNIDKIKSGDCRDYAIKNFSYSPIKIQYESYFQRILDYHEARRKNNHAFFFENNKHPELWDEDD